MGAPDRVHVVTAKAGIAGFTRALAMELAPHKITVNTLVPSMLARPGKPDEIPAHPVYRPLLGRAAWPSDIAPLARLLVGPGARISPASSSTSTAGRISTNERAGLPRKATL